MSWQELPALLQQQALAPYEQGISEDPQHLQFVWVARNLGFSRPAHLSGVRCVEGPVGHLDQLASREPVGPEILVGDHVLEPVELAQRPVQHPVVVVGAAIQQLPLPGGQAITELAHGVEGVLPGIGWLPVLQQSFAALGRTQGPVGDGDQLSKQGRIGIPVSGQVFIEIEVAEGPFTLPGLNAGAIGRPHGLLQSERLERLVFLQAEARGRRNASEHQLAISRLQRLLHHCGGIELGDDLQAQDGLCQPSAEQRRRQLQTLRCSCKSEAYAAIRQGQLPFPLDQIRLERPAKQAELTAAAQGTTADWVHPALVRVLTPNPIGDSHPHPLEIDLPPWILARGSALRRWLFSHGSALRIEAPEALRQEQQGQALEVLALGQRR